MISKTSAICYAYSFRTYIVFMIFTILAGNHALVCVPGSFWILRLDMILLHSLSCKSEDYDPLSTEQVASQYAVHRVSSSAVSIVECA